MNYGISKGNFIIYTIIVILFSIFLIYIFSVDRINDTRHEQSTHAVLEWTDYQTEESMTQTVISGTITVDDTVGNILAFYSVHQNVRVFMDNQLVYRYPVLNNNPVSHSPGYNWNFVTLPEKVNNIEIEISSPYKSCLDNIPAFFIGNNFSVPAHIIATCMFPFALCIIIMMIGIIMIIYHCVISKHVNTDGKLLKLGIFSFLLSLWSLNECRVTILMMQNNLVTSYFSIMSLMILPIPFAAFVKTFYEDDSCIWDIFCKIDFFQIFFCILMQLIDMYDLRETLWTTHVMIFLLMFIICVQSFRLFKSNHSRMVKLHIICIVVCSVALITDIIAYYFGFWGGNTFGRIGFLAYIVVLCIASTGESASLMKKGLEANAYQTLAYTDQMTGLNNRTCFNIDFEKSSHSPEDIMIIDFDLNNLKYVNDTFGHSIGDQYIKDCANIIYDIFKGIGKCYRVGGDEFVAIIKKSSQLDITHYLTMLEFSVDALNKENRQKGMNIPKMQIAYGCAVYASELDKNLEETYNRADKLMYEDKKAKKEVRKI